MSRDLKEVRARVSHGRRASPQSIVSASSSISRISCSLRARICARSKQRRAEMAKLQQAAAAARIAAERAARRARAAHHRDRSPPRSHRRARRRAAERAGEVAADAGGHELRHSTRGVDGSALPIRPFRGDLDWPVDRPHADAIRRARRQRLTTRRRGPACSSRLQEGSPVRAVHDGTVAFAGPFTGYGNLVIVDHGAQTFLALRTAGRVAGRTRRESRARPGRRHGRAASWPEFPGCTSRCASTASRSIR